MYMGEDSLVIPMSCRIFLLQALRHPMDSKNDTTTVSKDRAELALQGISTCGDYKVFLNIII